MYWGHLMYRAIYANRRSLIVLTAKESGDPLTLGRSYRSPSATSLTNGKQKTQRQISVSTATASTYV